MLSNQLNEEEYKNIIKRLQDQNSHYINGDAKSLDRKVVKNLLKNLLDEIFKDEKNFLFELIQNADDQKATEIKISLQNDCLTFSHNSKNAFTGDDLSGISDAGRISKKRMANKIGQKGIGFKNVFKITKYPKIFCGNLRFTFRHEDEHYRIIYPQWLNEPKKDDEKTYFIFDLDIENVSSKLIIDALNLVNPQTLLFLNNIEKIIINDDKIFYKKNVTIINKNASLVEVGIENTSNKLYYHVFSKEITLEGTVKESWERSNPPRISVAVELNDKKEILAKVIRNDDGELAPDFYVYLPTKLHLGFRFILHGDFDTEVDRKDITDPSSNKFNEYMLISIGELFEIIIKTYKNDPLNCVRFLDLIPQESDNLNNPLFVEFIQKNLFDSLKDKELFLVEGYDNLFKKAKDISLNLENLNRLINEDDSKLYYSETHDKRFLLSLKLTSERALNFFNQMEGNKLDFELILDLIEYIAKIKLTDWFMVLYGFLADFIKNVPLEEKTEIETKLRDKEIILTKSNKLVKSSRTVFYHDENIDYLDIENLKPLFLKEELDLRDKEAVQNKEKIIEFLGDVLKVKQFNLNLYFTDYIQPWITTEHIKEDEHIYNFILNFLFKFSTKISFKGSKFFLFDRNNELLSHKNLFLGNDYKNEYHVETIFHRCGIEVKYLNDKYFKILQGDLKEIKDFFVEIGTRNIIPVVADPNSKVIEGLSSYNLPDSAIYVIPEEEYNSWPDYIIESQRRHGHIYKLNNYFSNQLKSIVEFLSNLNENDKKYKEVKYKVTELILTMLDKNWERYYSNFLFCKIYYNPNKTKGTQWRSYSSPKGYKNSALTNFGKLIKFEVKIPNSKGAYFQPSVLCLDNPVDKMKLIGIKLFCLAFIKFLSIQGSSSISDLVEHLRNLKKNNDYPENQKEMYLEIYQKLKTLESDKQSYISELKELIFLPDEKRWYSVSDRIYFDDFSGINRPYFANITDQLKLKGKIKEQLKTFFVNKLGLKFNPSVDEYLKIFDKFPSSHKLIEDELEIVYKLVNFLIEEDENVLLGKNSIPNNNGFLCAPGKLYFLDIPLRHPVLDETIINEKFNKILLKSKLEIKRVSSSLAIKEEKQYFYGKEIFEKLDSIRKFIFIIKQMINSRYMKDSDNSHDDLKIKLVESVTLIGPNNMEIETDYYFDKIANLVYFNPQNIDIKRMKNFVFLFIDYLDYAEISKEIEINIEWLFNLVEHEIPEHKIISLLEAQNFNIQVVSYVPIPIINETVLEKTETPNSRPIDNQNKEKEEQLRVEALTEPNIDFSKMRKRSVILKYDEEKKFPSMPIGRKPEPKNQGKYKEIHTPYGTQKISISFILDIEMSEGFNANYLDNREEQKKFGCDIISTRGKETKYIEIKGYTSKKKLEFQVQQSQYKAMIRNGENYWIYLVKPDLPISIIRINNPLERQKEGKLTLTQSPHYFCELHGEFEEEYYED